MRKWDYIKEYDLTPKDLKELGLKGWELIVVNTNFRIGGSVFYFKREIIT